jgi:hypothetical protein
LENLIHEVAEGDEVNRLGRFAVWHDFGGLLQFYVLFINEGALVMNDLEGELVFAVDAVHGFLDSAVVERHLFLNAAAGTLEQGVSHLRVYFAAPDDYPFNLNELVDIL